MRPLPPALRFDGAWWRRFAELGCVYGPEWWKRGSPPLIAAVVYLVARRQRVAVRRNQRRVQGPAASWLAEHWRAYRVFAAFARSMTEGMEQWGPRPRPLRIEVPDTAAFEEALREGRGVVVATGHFGAWDVCARSLPHLGRPVTMVTAHESNPTVRRFVHRMRTRYGHHVLYSDRSLFGAVPLLRALRRGEIVGMQIDPWGPLAGTCEVPFCGVRTRFQLGPFALGRIAGVPVVPVFSVRLGIRHYRLHIAGRFDVRTPAQAEAALHETVRIYETLVRAHPEQWMMFEDVWPAAGGADGYEMVPQASG